MGCQTSQQAWQLSLCGTGLFVEEGRVTLLSERARRSHCSVGGGIGGRRKRPVVAELRHRRSEESAIIEVVNWRHAAVHCARSRRAAAGGAPRGPEQSLRD